MRPPRLDLAITDVDRVIKFDPTNWHAWQTKGDILTRTDQLDDAEAAYNRAFNCASGTNRIKSHIRLSEVQQLQRARSAAPTSASLPIQQVSATQPNKPEPSIAQPDAARGTSAPPNTGRQSPPHTVRSRTPRPYSMNAASLAKRSSQFSILRNGTISSPSGTGLDHTVFLPMWGAGLTSASYTKKDGLYHGSHRTSLRDFEPREYGFRMAE